nr:STAS domain-containing protein [Endozoicomonas sp.]
MELTINLESHENYTLLMIEGDINTSTVHILENAIRNATTLNHNHIVLDCTLLKSINGDGLGLLLHCQVQLSEYYYFSLYNVSDEVASLMELSGITHFIQMNTQAENAKQQHTEQQSA